MAQIVDVPGVGEVEFPDEMSDADVVAAIKKISPAPNEGKPLALNASMAPESESAARGGLQGLSFGWGDEATGALAAILPFAAREELTPPAGQPEPKTMGERYRMARDYYRRRNKAAQDSNPGAYMAGEVAGAVAPAIATLGASTPASGAAAAGKTASLGVRLLKGASVGAGQGAVQGAGFSDGSDAAGVAGDSLIGAGLGVAGRAVGQGLGGAASWASRKGAALASRGTQRAAEQAEKEVAEQLASAAGKTGAEVQKGSRYVENLMRLEASMTPEQRAVYAQLQASGVVPNLQQAVAGSTLEALPQQAGAIAARQAELAALQKAAPQTIASRAKDLLTPQVKADTKSFLKSYAEPLVWAGAGYKAADLAGLDPEQRATAAGVAGLIGGRTRAGKALWNRLSRPAHQVALGKALESAGNTGQGTGAQLLRALLARGAPAGGTAAAVAPIPVAGSEFER